MNFQSLDKYILYKENIYFMKEYELDAKSMWVIIDGPPTHKGIIESSKSQTFVADHHQKSSLLWDILNA